MLRSLVSHGGPPTTQPSSEKSLKMRLRARGDHALEVPKAPPRVLQEDGFRARNELGRPDACLREHPNQRTGSR